MRRDAKADEDALRGVRAVEASARRAIAVARGEPVEPEDDAEPAAKKSKTVVVTQEIADIRRRNSERFGAVGAGVPTHGIRFAEFYVRCWRVGETGLSRGDDGECSGELHCRPVDESVENAPQSESDVLETYTVAPENERAKASESRRQAGAGAATLFRAAGVVAFKKSDRVTGELPSTRRKSVLVDVSENAANDAANDAENAAPAAAADDAAPCAVAPSEPQLSAQEQRAARLQGGVERFRICQV